MDKRYQVFVSSTYADLKEERQRVIQALMEMDCIPSGMELFPAADEEQWDFIRKVIDDCDYYLLIIGGRYGSVTADGVSYTEKEYEYALERSIKVLALLHEAPEEIAVKNSESDPVLRERLRVFREKVKTGRLVRFWRSADQLPGLVALSLSKTIKTYPAVGWVRADRVPDEDILLEINNLRKENTTLQAEVRSLAAQTAPAVADLAGLDEKITVNGTYKQALRDSRGTTTSHYAVPCKVVKTWRELFALIAPELLSSPNDGLVKLHLERYLFTEHSGADISDQDYHTVKIQLMALKLVTVTYTSASGGGMGLFWNLTPQGRLLLMELRSVKSEKGEPAPFPSLAALLKPREG